MIIDTHCHIQFDAYKDDREEIIKRSQDKGVIFHVVGTQKDTSAWGVELAEKNTNMFASIGTHPIHLHATHVDEEESHFMSREEDFDEPYYEKLAQSPKVTAVGECGFDLFHVPRDVSPQDVLEKQKSVFVKHVAFANKHKLPMVIHVREAHDQMIALMRSKDALKTGIPKGVIHCYTSHWYHAQEYLGLGFYLGFTGVITFPPKKTHPEQQRQLLEVVKNIPLDRILIETDSPYLTPQIKRGERNEPWLVEEVAKKIAEIKGISLEEVTKATTQNALQLFSRMQLVNMW